MFLKEWGFFVCLFVFRVIELKEEGDGEREIRKRKKDKRIGTFTEGY